jgi:hypothetical protein
VREEGMLPARALLGGFAVVRSGYAGTSSWELCTVTGNDGRSGLAGLAAAIHGMQ